jgi:hypothetical protein
LCNEESIRAEMYNLQGNIEQMFGTPQLH